MSIKVTPKCPKVEGVGCWLRLCLVAGYASEARLLDATVGVAAGGAAGAFATALVALAFFRGMLDKCKQSWSVLGTTTQHIARPTVLLNQGVDTTMWIV